MKTLLDLTDRNEELVTALEEEGKKDPERSQELTNLYDQMHLLADVIKAALGPDKRGPRIYDAEPLFKIPRTTRLIFRPESWYSTPVKWECIKGHQFRRTLYDMQDVIDAGEEPCRICARVSAQGTSSMAMDARVKLVMQHDERGEDLDYENYVNAHEMHTYVSRTNGEAHTSRPKNVHVWARPWDRGKKDVWIAEDGQQAFLWCGAKPIVENPALVRLMTTADAVIEPYYDNDVRYKKGYTHRSGLERAILECVEAGAHVLNVSLNPQYQAPGIYEWGNLQEQNAALAEWIKDIQAKWRE